MVDPLSYFSFQPDWYNKGHGMCYLAYSAYKRVAHVAAAGFLSRYLSGPL